jgi:hypothetical protein
MEAITMARFLRCVGVDRLAYHVNVDQIAWLFRPHGANHTVIRFSGAPDAISVLETPHQITSGEHDEEEHRDHTSIARTRTAPSQHG